MKTTEGPKILMGTEKITSNDVSKETLKGAWNFEPPDHSLSKRHKNISKKVSAEDFKTNKKAQRNQKNCRQYLKRKPAFSMRKQKQDHKKH